MEEKKNILEEGTGLSSTSKAVKVNIGEGQKKRRQEVASLRLVFALSS